MKRILVIVLALVLALSIAGPAASMTQAMGGPSKITPDDLPVVKPPAELAGDLSVLTGSPQGAPAVKPDKPGEARQRTRSQ